MDFSPYEVHSRGMEEPWFTMLDGTKCDMFALGVILHIMLCGFNCFERKCHAFEPMAPSPLFDDVDRYHQPIPSMLRV